MAPGEQAVDGAYAWIRLGISLTVSMICGVGLWSVVVVLPMVEAEFEVARADASLPYTFNMLGFAAGGILMGRMVDRFGVTLPLIAGAVSLAAGYVASGMAEALWQFTLAHALLIGLFGSAVSFGPVIADISHWFERHRGVAIAVAASGSYLAGTVWPPIVEHFAQEVGWRQTHVGIGLFCLVTVVPLSLFLRRRPSLGTVEVGQETGASSPTARVAPAAPLLSPGQAQTLMVIAGLACCIAMAMPQVHIVAYCLELGFDTARGAEMLSLMLGTGIVSRLAFGWIADRIGPFRTLLLGSTLQALSLLLFLPFDELVPLYVVSALFGLSQGGIVPTYALIVRRVFPAAQAGTRVGLVLSATMVGMGVGGWMSGALYDLTLSYQAAFLNGIAWNVLNMAIALFLLLRLDTGRRLAQARA